jgi:hypothetical protein
VTRGNAPSANTSFQLIDFHFLLLERRKRGADYRLLKLPIKVLVAVQSLCHIDHFGRYQSARPDSFAY